MNYIIKINYNTGDSFTRHDGLEDEIDLNWENIEIVEENLKRIEEHYKWYLDKDSYKPEGIEKPKWLRKEADEYSSCINFKLDDGTEHLLSCCWLGYFDSLNYAEVAIKGKWIEF